MRSHKNTQGEIIRCTTCFHAYICAFLFALTRRLRSFLPPLRYFRKQLKRTAPKWNGYLLFPTRLSAHEHVLCKGKPWKCLLFHCLYLFYLVIIPFLYENVKRFFAFWENKRFRPFSQAVLSSRTLVIFFFLWRFAYLLINREFLPIDAYSP